MEIINRIYIGIALILFFLSSCVEKVDWPIQAVTDSSLVVDGILTDELKQHQITLTFPTNELNAVPEVASGATITMEDADTTIFLTESPAGSGIYLTDNLKAETNTNYSLNIQYNGKSYTAQTYLIPHTFFTPISYAYYASDSLYHFDWKMDLHFVEDAMYELFFDWSAVKGYDTLDISETQFQAYIYTLKTIDVNEIFAAQKESIAFPKGTTIIQKKHTLTPEHAEFIRAMLSETQWNGNIFDATFANVPTNLSEGAIGFWGGCSVWVDTIIVGQ